jgi:hypothetical protein
MLSYMALDNVAQVHDKTADDYDHIHKQQALVHHMHDEIDFEDIMNMYLYSCVHIPIRQ